MPQFDQAVAWLLVAANGSIRTPISASRKGDRGREMALRKRQTFTASQKVVIGIAVALVVLGLLTRLFLRAVGRPWY